MRKVCRVSRNPSLALLFPADPDRSFYRQLAREVLDHTASFLKPGITTDELDRICHEACVARDSYPSPLNYMNFPKSVCISVNEVICHVSV